MTASRGIRVVAWTADASVWGGWGKQKQKHKHTIHVFISLLTHPLHAVLPFPQLTIPNKFNMSLKRKAAEAASDATKKPKTNSTITSFFGAPKPNPNVKSAAAAKFDKDAWVAKLTDEQKELLQLELDTLHDSWLPHLKDVLLTPQFLGLKKFLKQELKSGKIVYPPMKDVYSWYDLVFLPIGRWSRG
jgi:hypothetical protein